MLITKNIYIRLLEKEDLKDRVQWINDLENINTLLFDFPTSISKTEKWFYNQLLEDSSIHFSIVEHDTHILIGMTGLLDIDYKNNKAQFYLTIGNKKFRGIRLPDQIIPLVLEYGFIELNLKKIYLYTMENNEKARHVYTRNGFKLDGVLRSHIYRRGFYRDIYVQSILYSDWLKKDE